MTDDTRENLLFELEGLKVNLADAVDKLEVAHSAVGDAIIERDDAVMELEEFLEKHPELKEAE